MNEVTVLEKIADGYEAKIRSYNSKISRLEEECDSLIRFKGSVESSQGTFHSINSGRINVLSGLDDIKTNNIIAQKYGEGMKNVFDGIGSKVVGAAYEGLLFMISVKLANYRSLIDEYEGKIAKCNTAVNNIEKEIKKEKQKEKDKDK